MEKCYKCCYCGKDIIDEPLIEIDVDDNNINFLENNYIFSNGLFTESFLHRVKRLVDSDKSCNFICSSCLYKNMN